MSDAFYVAAIGMQAQQHALDGIANNITNVNTPAFKRSQMRFMDLVATRTEAEVPADLTSPPVVLSGVAVRGRLALNEPGQVERTGQPLDLAIDGQGFFELMGRDGQTLLWRGGVLGVSEEGLLGTSDGVPFRAAITVPYDASALEIGADGMVRVSVAGQAEPIEIGQLELVQVDDVDAVERADGGIYRVPAETSLRAGVPGEDGAGTIVQGAIERSNVQLTDEMVQMILVQRAYAANAQIVQAADQLAAIANGLRR